MQKKLRVMLGILILFITAGSAIAVGITLPIKTIAINKQIDAKLANYGQLNQDDFDPYDGGNDTYSDWMYVSSHNADAKYYSKTSIEFYNVSDREAYLYKANPVSYIGVPGKLVFDLTIKRIVIKYDADNDYLVYTTRKQYTFNASESDLTGNEKILNFNYLWPYYINHFGNGSEYGFQAYVATFMIKSELEGLGYNNSQIADIVLNKTYADNLHLIYTLKYSPHKWINVRPDYKDINFDETTAYTLLFNSTTPDGHDYSLFTGESGSMKYFLDLIQGLNYDPSILTLNVSEKLASIYGLDTPQKIESAVSFAAYIRYLAGNPALTWLYDHKISYITPRTALEWVLGVPDPLMGGRKYPLLLNQSLDSYDPSTDLYYAVKTGAKNVSTVDQIIAIANIPSYSDSQSYKVVLQNNLAYVVEGNRGFRIVNTTDPLFLGIGGYRRQGYSYYDVALDKSLYGTTAYLAAGTKGIVMLDVSDPTEINSGDTWTNLGKVNVLDLEYTPTKTYLMVANGQYGVAKLATSSGTISSTSVYSTAAPAIALTTDGTKVFVVEQGRGIEVFNLATMESLSNTSIPNAQKALVKGNTLYVIDSVNGLSVYNIVGDNLVFNANYNFGTSGHFNDMYISNGILYLAAEEDGLIAVDISDVNSLSALSTFNKEGTAYGVAVDGNKVYLADGTKGLLYLNFSSTTHTFSDVIQRDELRTYVEAWNSPSFVQFNDWPLKTTQYHFNETYGTDVVPPRYPRGLTQRWSEFFFRPFIYDSSRDTTLFYDDLTYIHFADTQQPYLQVDQYSLYWQPHADYLNESFVHVGRWNKLYNTNWKPNEIYMTYTFPGSIRDEFHFQIIHTDPATGTISQKIDRVQYNTYASDYIEYYPFLNESAVSNTHSSIYKYRTWHQTYPKLTADMANLFWQEDLIQGTHKLYEYINNEFLGVLRTADSYRTSGAFGALFILTLGLIVSSMVIDITPVKNYINSLKK